MPTCSSARVLGLRNDLDKDEEVELALDVCTNGGAKVMALPNYGLAVGREADLVLVQARNLPEAVVAPPAAPARDQARPNRRPRRARAVHCTLTPPSAPCRRSR